MNTSEKDLVIRSFDQELDQAEGSELESLLRSDRAARRLQAEIRDLRAAVRRSCEGSFGPDFGETVMQATETPRGRGARFLRVVKLHPFAAAAAVALLAVTFGAIALLPRAESNLLVYSTPNGTTMSVSLPDGTQVELNAGSTITVSPNYSAERRLELSGEAFFKVAHTGSTFEVDTPQARIAVLGTEFNVRAWSAVEHRTIVALRNGSVSVTDRNSRTVVLEPGQQVQVSDAQRSGKETSNLEAATPAPTSDWRTGGLSFRNEPLEFVAAELERRYNITIELDPALIGKEATYLSQTLEDADTVLSTICESLGTSYTRTVRGYSIHSRTR